MPTLYPVVEILVPSKASRGPATATEDLSEYQTASQGAPSERNADHLMDISFGEHEEPPLDERPPSGRDGSQHSQVGSQMEEDQADKEEEVVREESARSTSSEEEMHSRGSTLADKDYWKKPKDLDGYNVSIYPKDLYKHCSPLSTLAFCAQVPQPKPRDHKFFKDWIYLARSIGFFLVAPEFKEPLLAFFKSKDITIQRAAHKKAFSSGGHTVHMATLLEALTAVECAAVRVQAYGMKTPLSSLRATASQDEPASNGHQHSRYNTFDLGVNYDNGRDNFVFFRSAYLNSTPVKTLPMCLEVGQGFGSTYTKFRRSGVPLTVKCYPLWIHDFKSISVKHATTQPKTHFAMRKRYSGMRKMVRSLQRVKVSGGCRVEVTVQYPSLWTAVSWISKTPFLNPKTYVKAPTREVASLKMDSLEVSHLDILKHATDMLKKAEQTGLLVGRDALPASARLTTVLKDCLNSIGWASVYWRPTAWNDEGAWWKEELPGPPPLDEPLVEEPHWNGNLWSVEEARTFYSVNQSLLPCPKDGCQQLGTHRLTGGLKQFRVSCSACKGHTGKKDSTACWIALYHQGLLAVAEDSFPNMLLTRPASPTIRGPSPDAPLRHPALQPPQVPNPHPKKSKRAQRAARRYREPSETPVVDQPEDPKDPEGSQFEPSSSEDSSGSEHAQPYKNTRGSKRKRGPTAPDTSTLSKRKVERQRSRSTTYGRATTRLGEVVRLPFAEQSLDACGYEWRFSKQYVPADNDCQFHALSFYAYGNMHRAALVRRRVVAYMNDHRSLITQYAAEGDGHLGATQWLRDMAREGTWGDQLSLHAAAEVYEMPLVVASRLPSGDHHWTFYPQGRPITEYVGLYHTGNHYELMFTVG